MDEIAAHGALSEELNRFEREMRDALRANPPERKPQ
jgi:hypothetical protein